MWKEVFCDPYLVICDGLVLKIKEVGKEVFFFFEHSSAK